VGDQRWRLKLYRDDSETVLVFENVKHAFLTGGNTILTIAQYGEDGSHHYINWPRERVCWWKLERATDRVSVREQLERLGVESAT
jgi:hypothetical protein